MRIKKFQINNHRKCLTINTAKGSFDYPLARLEGYCSNLNKIFEIYIDSELGNEAITYILESGKEYSIHLDVFLDYNRDPDFLRMIFLYELSVQAQKALKSSDLSKNEVCRRLKTSPSQLNRLLDQKNRKKSVDKMLELLAVLGVSVKPVFDLDKKIAS